MILVQIILLVLGFFLLVKGADWFVEGSAGIASLMRIPQIVIGLTIVAMGTSMPEAAVSITAALEGNAGISIGNVLGSNILNILIILGVTSVIVPVAVQKMTILVEIPFMLGITILLIGLGLSGNQISRGEGIVLWVVFLIYFVYLLFLTRREKCENCKVEKSAGLLLLFIVLGMGMIIGGSSLSVNAATKIAQTFGVSQRFIGLTIVALGTSLPELVTSVTAARKGNADIAIGNIVGSNIFNILFILGTSALILPIDFPGEFLTDGIVAVISGVLLWILAFPKKKLSRLAGVIMLCGYTGYFIYLLQ